MKVTTRNEQHATDRARKARSGVLFEQIVLVIIAPE